MTSSVTSKEIGDDDIIDDIIKFKSRSTFWTVVTLLIFQLERWKTPKMWGIGLAIWMLYWLQNLLNHYLCRHYVTSYHHFWNFGKYATSDSFFICLFFFCYFSVFGPQYLAFYWNKLQLKLYLTKVILNPERLLSCLGSVYSIKIENILKVSTPSHPIKMCFKTETDGREDRRAGASNDNTPLPFGIRIKMSHWCTKTVNSLIVVIMKASNGKWPGAGDSMYQAIVWMISTTSNPSAVILVSCL